MRILTFRRLIGLAAIGGVVYVHKQRGGTWSMASMRDTLHHLLSKATDKLGQMNQASQAHQGNQGNDNTRRPGEPRNPSMGTSSGSQPGSHMNPSVPRTRLPDDGKMRPTGDLNKRDDDNRH